MNKTYKHLLENIKKKQLKKYFTSPLVKYENSNTKKTWKTKGKNFAEKNQ